MEKLTRFKMMESIIAVTRGEEEKTPTYSELPSPIHVDTSYVSVLISPVLVNNGVAFSRSDSEVILSSKSLQ